MEDRVQPSRSGLFAIELVASVGIFTFCAALCVGLFVHAELVSRQSADLSRAVVEMRSVSECYRATKGSILETAELVGGFVEQSLLTVFYDENWNRLGAENLSRTAFTVELLPAREADGTLVGTVSASRAAENTAFLHWRVAVWEAAA